MGYLYDARGRLVCDSCGASGSVRKRTCPHTVTDENGQTLHYCTPAALCSSCYARKGGAKTLHARCAEGARQSQAEYDAIRDRLATGEARVRSAWGDWHETVPTGFVGACFVGADGIPHYRLVRGYDPNAKPWLSDYPDALPWVDHVGDPTKRVL